MKMVSVIILSAVLMMTAVGCNISKPYVMKVERTDQDLAEGNKGYLKGTPPPPKDRGDLKRPFLAIDIDLPDTGSGSTAKTENIK